MPAFNGRQQEVLLKESGQVHTCKAARAQMYKYTPKTQIACKWPRRIALSNQTFHSASHSRPGHVLHPHSIAANSAIDSHYSALIHY